MDDYTRQISEVGTRQNAALEYAARGWKVLPIWWMEGDRCMCGKPCGKNAGKHPLGRLVPRGHLEATRDETLIRDWWRQYPMANIGIATGQVSGIWALDSDVKDDGPQVLQALIEENGGVFPETLMATTASGGSHFLFQYPDFPVRNYVRIRQGLDVRGDGGHIIVSPSEVRGTPYSWKDANGTIAAAPEWLIGILKEAAKYEPLDTEAILQGMPEGQRDVALFRWACKLRGAGVPEALANGLMLEAARNCDPPFDEDAALEKVKRAYAKYPKQYATTDRGNAEFIGDVMGQDIRWCQAERRWYIWTGTHWSTDEVLGVEARAKEVIRLMHTWAASIEDEDRRNAAKAHVHNTESHFRLTQMLAHFKSEPGIPVTRDQFNKHDWLLPVRNGTLDLETGELLDHNRKHYFTKCLEYNYDAKATCPRWMQFLGLVTGGDAELQGYLQRVAGYMLTGSNSEKAFFFSYGDTDTGKSVFAQALAMLLGPFAMKVSSQSFMTNKRDAASHSEDVAQMDGARFVYATEGDRGQRLNEGLIKVLTGDDTIRARALHQNSFEFKVRAKVWFASNYKPLTSGSDNAIWNRVKLVPFGVVIPMDVRKPREQALEELRAELPGILNWALEGLRLYLLDRPLREPTVVRQAVEEYRKEMDTIGEFIEEWCTCGASKKIQSRTLYSFYANWCRENGTFALGSKTFSQELKKKGFTSQHTSDGTTWYGLEIRSPHQFATSFGLGTASLN